MARRSGLDRSTISLLERAERQPSVDTLFRLGEALLRSPSSIVSALENDGRLPSEVGQAGVSLAKEEDALQNWESRTAFATRTAKRLLTRAGGELGSATPILYAVWVRGVREAIYIGQSLDGKRRLWDLAIGESHHLANTFSPELWSKVAYIEWETLFSEVETPEFEAAKNHFELDAGRLRESVCLGLEFKMIQTYQPLFNRYRRSKRDGRLQEVGLSRSRSRGALCAPFLEAEFALLKMEWERALSGALSKVTTVVSLEE